MSDSASLAGYIEAIQYDLLEAHKISRDLADSMINEFLKIIEVHHAAGLPAIDLCRWIYLECKDRAAIDRPTGASA